MSDLELSDAELTAAAADLAGAAIWMVSDIRPRPTNGFESLSGIAAEVDLYLRGVSVARAALADAAKGSSTLLLSLIEDSTDLDSVLAGSLYPGYAVQGAKR